MHAKYLILKNLKEELDRQSIHSVKDKEKVQELKEQLDLIARIDKKTMDLLSSEKDGEVIELENFWQYLHLSEMQENGSKARKCNDSLNSFLASFLRALSSVLIRTKRVGSEKTNSLYFSTEELEKLQQEFEMAKTTYRYSWSLPEVALFSKKYTILEDLLVETNLKLIEVRKRIKETKEESTTNEITIKKREEELKSIQPDLEKAEKLLNYNRKSHAIIEAKYHENYKLLVEMIQEKEFAKKNTGHSKKPAIYFDDTKMKSKLNELSRNQALLKKRITENNHHYQKIKEHCDKIQANLKLLKGKSKWIIRKLNDAKRELSALKENKIDIEGHIQKIPETLEKIKKNLVIKVTNLKLKQACYHYLQFPYGFVCINFQSIEGHDHKVDSEIIQSKILLTASNTVNTMNKKPELLESIGSQGKKEENIQLPAPTICSLIFNFRKNTPTLTKYCDDIVHSMVQEKGLVLSEIVENHGKEIIDNKEKSEKKETSEKKNISTVLNEYQLDFGAYSSVKTFLHSLRERLGNEFYLRLVLALYWSSRYEHSVKFNKKLINVFDFATEEQCKTFLSSQLCPEINFKFFKKTLIALSHLLKFKENGVKLPPAANPSNKESRFKV